MREFEVPHHKVFPVFPFQMIRGSLDLPLETIVKDVNQLINAVKEMSSERSVAYTTYFNHAINTKMNDLEWYAPMKANLLDMYVQYCVEYLGHQSIKELSRDDLHFFIWANKYDRYSQHMTHNHINSVLSGTLYIKTGDTSAPICFQNPAKQVIFNHTAFDSTQYNRDNDYTYSGTKGSVTEIFFNPNPGEFLMWPSYMDHRVEPCRDPKNYEYDRISLSFNIGHSELAKQIFTPTQERSNDFLYKDVL